jgi:hypothetical protein
VIAGADERAVPEASLETPRLADEESELHRCLAGRFPSLRGIRRAAFGGQTSFRLEVLTLELGAAGEVKLLLKDFGASRLPKDDLPSRRNRELRVYRDLLAGGGLGTAEYHGAVWDEARGRFWLLLELVDGVELRSLGFEDWVRSAAWLGRLHGRFARAGEALEASDFLVRHDAGFFHAQAEQASRAAATYPLELREPVLAVTRRYSRAVEVLVGGPRTLVHGSYRPQNILVDRAARPPPGAGRRLGALSSRFSSLRLRLPLGWLPRRRAGRPVGSVPGRGRRPRPSPPGERTDGARPRLLPPPQGPQVHRRLGRPEVRGTCRPEARHPGRRDRNRPPFLRRETDVNATPPGSRLEGPERPLAGPDRAALTRADLRWPQDLGLPPPRSGARRLPGHRQAVQARGGERGTDRRLPLTRPAYYGSAPAGEGWSWILPEEIRGTKLEVLSEEHRALTGRWLGY